ncbi:MAG TPA: PAAR domain-containing protein [Panacibacter sp.]|nr:PAAR domain-containing protein [Panacibacter sp.]
MGKPAARIGDMHVCPMFDGPKPHVGGPIVGPGCPTVLIGGMPAAVMGDMCTCVGPPDTIILGSAGVFIGGKPAARMGDQCVHGGAITVGLPTVLIGETMAGGGSFGAIPLAIMQTVMKSMPPAVQQKMAQVVAMKQAAANGSPFCEKCAAAAMK